ncbi:phosphotransferase [Aestuariibius sp. 2305UL40-4]|uniref:phosphotransferase n=1 Tax=Aestuariibius violaceus TaxID=3234132 RepID=UPI00345E5E4E
MLGLEIRPYRSALERTWQALVREIGVDPASLRSEVLWRRVEDDRVRFVLRLKRAGAPDLIFKQVFAPHDPEAFRISTVMQERMAGALRPPFAAPRVLARADNDLALLMEEAPGLTAHDALLEAYGDAAAQVRVMRSVGGWIGAFHRTSPQPERPFRPSFILNHMRKRRRELEDGAGALRRPAHYRRALAALMSYGEPAKGAVLPVGPNHGDLHAKNILIGPDVVNGIDFRNAHDAPVCYDLARFLVDATARVIGPPSEGGSLLGPDLAAAFWEGYGTDLSAHPALDLMIRVRLLEDWQAMPEGRLGRMQRVRFDNILALASDLLAA